VWDKEHFWGKSLAVLPQDDTVEQAESDPDWAKFLPTVMGVSGILLAYVCYMWSRGLADKIAGAFRPLYQLFFRKWYFDELYDIVFVRNAWWIGRVFSTTGDRKLIDGWGPDGLSALSSRLGDRLSRFQSGYVYHYAFVMMIGLISIVTWLLYKTMQGY
jgi:NADH-quinone oxidoreductase subunit L